MSGKKKSFEERFRKNPDSFDDYNPRTEHELDGRFQDAIDAHLDSILGEDEHLVRKIAAE